MKRALICFVVFLGVQFGVAFAQTAPNCNQQNAILTAVSTGPNYNATSIKCVAWTFSYFSQGFSVISIQVEFAPDVAGVPGAFVVVPAGNIASGTNPLTSLTSGTMTINGYFPWVRVNLVTATGTGSVNYTLIGNSYVGPSSSITTGAGAASTVSGPDAAGTPPTKNPVQNSGFDGTNVQRIRTDTSGRTVVVGPTGKNTAETGNPIWIAGTDGATVRALLTDTSGDLRVAGSPATATDGISNGALNTFQVATNAPSQEAGFIFNGSTWDRERSPSLNNDPVSTVLTARNSIGAHLAEKGSRWTVVSTPAVSTQASASIAAEAAVRHVVDCVTFSAGSTTAPALTKLNINLRDGATGAGTIIKSYTVVISAATGQNVNPQTFCGLNLVGTTNTAMTLEFSALLTNLFEDVTLTGYNIN